MLSLASPDALSHYLTLSVPGGITSSHNSRQMHKVKDDLKIDGRGKFN